MVRKPWLSASSDEYMKQRMRALVRDNFTCQFCGKVKFNPDLHLFGAAKYQKAIEQWECVRLTDIDGDCRRELPCDILRLLEVHHIIPRIHFLPHEFEGHDLSNLITLCKMHHAQIHPHMRWLED